MNHSFFNKTIIFLTIVSIVFICISCTLPMQQDATTSVVATNFPAYDFAKQVCGHIAQTTMLLPAGGENHSYEPTAQDIIKINNCDLFIFSGGESDAWVDKILSSLDEKVNTLKMTDCVSLIPVGEHEDEFDEHVWTSPANAVLIVEKIKDNLSVIDKSNKKTYEENAANYIKQITELDNDFSAFFDTVENKTMIFCDRFPFVYLLEDYGIEYAAAFEGCSADADADFETVLRLIKEADEHSLSAVTVTESSDRALARTVLSSSAQGGGEIIVFNSLQSVNKGQIAEGISYLTVMEDNLKALRRALGI